MSGRSGEWPGLRRAFRLPRTLRRRVREEVEAELRFHLEGRIEELMVRGMTRAEAEAEARQRFGDVARIRAEVETVDNAARRQHARGEWMDSLWRDIRYAVRGLAQRRGFALTVLLTLALGIGANSAIFSAVDGVLLRPLPVSWLDDLVVIQDDLPALNLHNTEISPGEALDLLERRDLFQAFTGYNRPNLNLTGSGEPQRVSGVATLGDFFQVFGGRPYLGRLYTHENSRDGKHLVVVLSYAFWQQLTGGDPRVIGTSLRLNDDAYEVIGVMPPEFRYPRTAQLWMPFRITPRVVSPEQRGSLYITAVARLRPRITIGQLREQLVAEAERWRERYPDVGYGSGATTGRAHPVAQPFVRFLAGQLRPILLVLLGAVGLVLLIACANVASMQLVRSAGRAKEIAVRTALGAGRWSIVRQLLVESLVLALLGGGVGLVLAALVVRLVARTATTRFAMLGDVHLDTPVLLFTLAVTIVAALLSGVIPAVRSAQVEVSDVLKESSARGTSGGPRQSRLLGAAVVVQVALALVLLLGAGVVVRSLAQLLDLDPGFRAANVYTMQLALRGDRYQTNPSRLAFHDALIERLRGMPGVQAAGTVYGLPFSDLDNSSPFQILDRPPAPGEPERHAKMWYAGGDYFRAMGMTLKRGRYFADADAEGTDVVSVIDETLAKQFFPGENPVGKRIQQGFPSTIVGVVSTVKKNDLAEPDKATIYYPFRQLTWALGNMSVVIRTSAPPAAAATMLRGAVRELDPSLPVFDVMSMSERVGQSLGARRLAVLVLTGFGALALLLAVLGIHGVLTYSTSQRTHEIGIRIALGARPADVIRLVLRNGIALAGGGIAAGLLIYLLASRLITALVYGVSPRDPVTMVAIATVLAATALIASYLPARRAARVDPIAALRAE